LGVGLLIITADVLYNIWQASQNKEKFQSAIKEAEKALD
jgi:hypothetical protein